jgi:hypothetical protein
VNVSGRVRIKADRRTRALVLVLCIAPVAAPITAAGINNLMKGPAAPVSAQAPKPEPTPAPALRPSLQPPLRATLEDPFLSPKPMGGEERLEQKPAAEPQQMIAMPRVNAAQAPPVRASQEDPFLSPKPMGGEERLEQKPAAKPQQMIAMPRVNGAQVLREVIVIDGLRLAADGKVIALAGIGSVPEGSECRRLDGVTESCSLRAANRLDVLTKGRPVTCDVKESDTGRLRGVCHAGKIDLAEDLVRNGLAVRTSDGR